VSGIPDIYIETKITARLTPHGTEAELKDIVFDDGEGNVEGRMRELAWMALMDFLPQSGHVLESANNGEWYWEVRIEPDHEDDAEVWAE